MRGELRRAWRHCMHATGSSSPFGGSWRSRRRCLFELLESDGHARCESVVHHSGRIAISRRFVLAQQIGALAFELAAMLLEAAAAVAIACFATARTNGRRNVHRMRAERCGQAAMLV